jgi:hypothetical protein
MQIPKQEILELLAGQGQDERVEQARRELPDQVEPEQHADLLERVGLNPRGLVARFGGDMPTI